MRVVGSPLVQYQMFQILDADVREGHIIERQAFAHSYASKRRRDPLVSRLMQGYGGEDAYNLGPPAMSEDFRNSWIYLDESLIGWDRHNSLITEEFRSKPRLSMAENLGSFGYYRSADCLRRQGPYSGDIMQRCCGGGIIGGVKKPCGQ